MTLRTRTRANKIADGVLAVVFFVMLWLPLADNVLGLDHAEPSCESRALATAPPLEFDENALKVFPQRFETFYDDHFGFRDLLMRCYHVAHLRWLGVAQTSEVLWGKDGWLFLGREALLEESRGLARMPDASREAWRRALKSVRDWQAARGGVFRLAIIPDKHAAFPEHLPDWYESGGGTRFKEQMMAELAAHSEVEVLDLLPAVLAGKERAVGPIWNKYDTHWNGVGAYYGYRALLEELHEVFPVLAPLPRDAFEQVGIESRTDAGRWQAHGNLTAMLGVRDLLPEPWIGLEPKASRARPVIDFPEPGHRVADVNVPYATECADTSLPRAIVVGDSFRWALVPLLSEHFSRVLYVDFRHCFFDPEVFEAERPDIVIYTFSQRQFLWFPEPPGHTGW